MNINQVRSAAALAKRFRTKPGKLSRKQIIALKNNLRAAGMYAGPANAKVDKKFKSALFRFAQVAARAPGLISWQSKVRKSVLSMAGREVGTKEIGRTDRGAVTKYPRFFGRGAEAYCADFVSYLYTRSGYRWNYAYVPYMKRDLINRGRWIGRTNPMPGDLVVFDWQRDGIPDHTGIVTHNLGGGRIRTIEANTINPKTGQYGVWRRTRTMGTIVGFGRLLQPPKR